MTGTGTNWTSSLLGLQFRFGAVAPIYTIVSIDSPTQLTLDLPFGGIPPAQPTGYQIFLAYLTPPADFQDFISVVDTFNNYRLWLHLTREEVDTYDGQRSWAGNPYGIVDFRYGTSPTAGSVSSAVMAVGTPADAAPVTHGTYTGRTDSIFVITVTLTGPVGTATYSWAKDNGTVNSGLVSDQAAVELQEGVIIQWPSNIGNYQAGDIFVCKARPGYSITVPMYELWPYSMAQRVYPFMYDKRFPDLDDPTGLVPPFIDADVLVKGALADVCRWRGTATTPNPMYGLDTAMSFEKEFQAKVAEMEREDDEVYLQDIRYQISSWSSLGMAPMPFAMGANWAQNHAVGA